MGLVDKIKQDVKKSGQNKSKFMYFREGQKVRVRFLTDMDDGMEVTFHDSFQAGINVPCQELFGRSCPHCDDDSLRTRSQYIWSVWDYDAKEVKLFMFPVNNCSPIPALMAMYENYGTICDRDYVISVTGKQRDKTFSVVPMDKVKFRNEKAKAYADKAILGMLDKAWPCDASDDEDDDDYDAGEDWGDDDDDKVDYSELSPKELYNLCNERKIKVAPKKTAKYYINQLEEYDVAHEDWEDEGEDDDWEDE